MDQIHEKFIAIRSYASPLHALHSIALTLREDDIFPRSFSVVSAGDDYVYTFGYNPDEHGLVEFSILPLAELRIPDRGALGLGHGSSPQSTGVREDSLTDEINSIAAELENVICHSLWISAGQFPFIVFMRGSKAA